MRDVFPILFAFFFRPHAVPASPLCVPRVAQKGEWNNRLGAARGPKDFVWAREKAIFLLFYCFFSLRATFVHKRTAVSCGMANEMKAPPNPLFSCFFLFSAAQLSVCRAHCECGTPKPAVKRDASPSEPREVKDYRASLEASCPSRRGHGRALRTAYSWRLLAASGPRRGEGWGGSPRAGGGRREEAASAAFLAPLAV
ncbi:hypothetical protein TcCL_ESM11309, partial [Trypanosoma cruzi]